MRNTRVFAFALAALLTTLPLLAAGDKKVFEKSYAFGEKEQKIGIKVDDVVIESFRIRNWPDAEDFEKAEKDLNDTHTMVVEFTYSNRDLDRDYKCTYTVTIPGKDGKPYGTNDRTATLDKGKVDDTNKMFVKMRTNEYKAAKKIEIKFEIWRK